MSIDKDVTKLKWDELLRSFAFGNSAENEGSLRQEIDRRIARLEQGGMTPLLNDKVWRVVNCPTELMKRLPHQVVRVLFAGIRRARRPKWQHGSGMSFAGSAVSSTRWWF